MTQVLEIWKSQQGTVRQLRDWWQQKLLPPQDYKDKGRKWSSESPRAGHPPEAGTRVGCVEEAGTLEEMKPLLQIERKKEKPLQFSSFQCLSVAESSMFRGHWHLENRPLMITPWVTQQSREVKTGFDSKQANWWSPPGSLLMRALITSPGPHLQDLI